MGARSSRNRGAASFRYEGRHHPGIGGRLPQESAFAGPISAASAAPIIIIFLIFRLSISGKSARDCPPSLTGKRSQSAGMGTGCPGGLISDVATGALLFPANRLLDHAKFSNRERQCGGGNDPAGSAHRDGVRGKGSNCGASEAPCRNRCAVAASSQSTSVVETLPAPSSVTPAPDWRSGRDWTASRVRASARSSLTMAEEAWACAQMRQPTEAAEQVALPRVCLSMTRQNSSRASRRRGRCAGLGDLLTRRAMDSEVAVHHVDAEPLVGREHRSLQVR